jgi:hypothetical protein
MQLAAGIMSGKSISMKLNISTMRNQTEEGQGFDYTTTALWIPHENRNILFHSGVLLQQMGRFSSWDSKLPAVCEGVLSIMVARHTCLL